VNEAKKAKHLKVIKEDYNGGMHVKCIANDKKNCDNGYKPTQCKIYPFWFRSDGTIEKSTRCPLKLNQLNDHKEKMIIETDFTDVSAEFLNDAEINSYERI
jgi:Fe-S-cluster containining protein